MFFETLTSISKLWQRGREDALEALLSAEQTRKMLQRERSRCDRSGSCFSLLCFSSRDGNRAMFLRLLGLLQKRLRSTDETGWLDEQRIGVLLPDTAPPGAWIVMESIYQAWPDDLPPPLCEVYTYPHSGTTESEGGTEAPSEVLSPTAGSISPIQQTGEGALVQKDQGSKVGASPVGQAAPLEVLLLQPLPRWKRFLDVVCASVGLLLLTPLLLLVGLAVRLTSAGPILFKQRRTGFGGRPFTMYKFRTMVADAEQRHQALLALNEQDGPAFKLKNDPRVTRLGRWLRRTSLDELPQLWNVLRGDMSLVGPRPLPCYETAAFAGWQRRRLEVLPGLTCIWQVRGRCQVSFAEWMRMDMRYIHSQSLGQDLKILRLQTIPAVVVRRGAQ